MLIDKINLALVTKFFKISIQMKKIIAVLTLLLAFTIGANAQDKKVNVEEAAKQDAFKITEFLGLSGTQQDDFVRLFEMKHQTLSDASLSQERKTEMSRIVEMKIRASLTQTQLQKLETNPELMATLTGKTTKSAATSVERKK